MKRLRTGTWREIWCATAILYLLLPPAAATGQGYPARPIRIVVGTPPGSGIDVGARIIGARMRDTLGQAIVMELRPGADGIIAARHVATSAPDGYTLLAASNGHMAINPVVHDKLSYDPLVDFEPVSMLTRNPSALVLSTSVPVRSVREFVAYAKNRPGELRYGSSSSNYMFAMEQFKQLAGIDLQHIPYPGNPQVGIALLSSEVQAAIVSVASSSGLIQTGKLNAIAMTGQSRDPKFPDIPTLLEAGVRGYDMDVWVGLFAPSGTVSDIVGRLNAAIQRSLGSRDVVDQLVAAGLTPSGSTPRFLRETIVRDLKTYRELAAIVPASSK